METIFARPKLAQQQNTVEENKEFFKKLCEAIAYPHAIITQGTKDKAAEIMRLFEDRDHA